MKHEGQQWQGCGANVRDRYQDLREFPVSHLTGTMALEVRKQPAARIQETIF